MRRPSKLWQSEENFRHQKIIKKNSSQSNLMIRLLTLLATITSGYPKGPPRRSPVNLIKVRHVGYQFYSDFWKKKRIHGQHTNNFESDSHGVFPSGYRRSPVNLMKLRHALKKPSMDCKWVLLIFKKLTHDMIRIEDFYLLFSSTRSPWFENYEKVWGFLR